MNVDVKTGLGTIVGASVHVPFAGIVLGQRLFWHVSVGKKKKKTPHSLETKGSRSTFFHETPSP